MAARILPVLFVIASLLSWAFFILIAPPAIVHMLAMAISGWFVGVKVSDAARKIADGLEGK